MILEKTAGAMLLGLAGLALAGTSDRFEISDAYKPKEVMRKLDERKELPYAVGMGVLYGSAAGLMYSAVKGTQKKMKGAQ